MIVTFITFLLVYLMPGDAVSLMVDLESADESVLQALREQYDLDASFLQQYLSWLADIVRGDFGTSVTYNAPVLGVVLKRLAVTFSMGLVSLCEVSPLMQQALERIGRKREADAMRQKLKPFILMCLERARSI